jgi:hypothetical protein
MFESAFEPVLWSQRVLQNILLVEDNQLVNLLCKHDQTAVEIPHALCWVHHAQQTTWLLVLRSASQQHQMPFTLSRGNWPGSLFCTSSTFN